MALKDTRITVTDLGLFAASRGVLGVGIGLLLSTRLARRRRVALGGLLIMLGALSTIPLAVTVLRRSRAQHDGHARARPGESLLS